MSEFRRRLMMTAKAKELNYVKTGLIHWWDGIWNKEEGVHDGDSTVWYDLVGNNNMTLSGTTENIAFTDNSLVIKAWDINTRTILSSAITFQDSNATMEIVCSSKANDRSYQNVFAGNSSKAPPFFLLYRYGNFVFKQSSGHAVGGNATTAQHYACDYSTHTLYNNGVQVSVVSGQQNGTGVAYNGINYSRQSGSYTYAGNVYAIRLYNRVLSASEILNNYKVDKQRFSLS